MKSTYKSIFCTIVLVAASACAKHVDEGTNFGTLRYLEAWMQLKHPGVTAKWNGVDDRYGFYTIGDPVEGTGAEVTKDGYAIVEYTVTDLKGNISAYTNKETAKQLGDYDTTRYYGPKVWLTTDETLQAGLQNALVGMNVGGSKKVVIPSWLMTYSKMSSTADYFSKQSDNSNVIYDFTIKDFTKDIDSWQIERMKEYMNASWGGEDTFNKNIRKDTTGFFFKSLVAKDATAKDFKTDTTIYINYTGRLLNGLVFDTTIERVALDNGLSTSKTFGPVQISWGKTHSDITMGSSSSSVVGGFSLTLWNMQDLGKDKMDKAVGIFYSPLGYGYNGQEPSIPGYSPLVFEIEIVAKPE